MDQGSGLIEFTDGSTTSRMTTAKGRHEGIMVEEARMLSPAALGKDGIFDR